MAEGLASSYTPGRLRQAPAEPARARGLIPEAFLDRLKERANIVDVVARRIKLRKAGAGFVGLCPFHVEKTPSFTVSPQRGTFHCFGCGAHGNSIGFVMNHDGLPFIHAVRELAQEVGLELPGHVLGADSMLAHVRTPLYDAMRLADHFFRRCLSQDATAGAYLRKRGVQPRMLESYAIGYAPGEWRGLRQVFGDYAFSQAVVQTGLVREKPVDESGSDRLPIRYDAFRDRLMFGVRDNQGRVVAFGGRTLRNDSPGDGPKYLNSPQSPIFDKSTSLFGLYEARESIRALGQVIVVEGYLDVIILAQHGFGNVVAAMGTSFSRAHLERLLTQTPSVVFCFDGDNAGRQAARRAVSLCATLLQDRHDFRFVTLDEGLDPDDFVQHHGARALRELIEAAPCWTEFMLATLQAEHGIEPGRAIAANAHDRAKFASQALEIAGLIPPDTQIRGIVMEQIALHSKMPGSALAVLQGVQPQSVRRDLWQMLVKSAEVAPSIALSVRQEVLGLLDVRVPGEAALAQALHRLESGMADDDAASPGFMMARDLLLGSNALIVEHRQQQLRRELDRQLKAGVIGDLEYLHSWQKLVAGHESDSSLLTRYAI